MKERIRESVRRGWEDNLAPHLPESFVGTLDLVMPHFDGGWSGPVNGQSERQQVIRTIAAALKFELVVETGTFRGYSTRFLAREFNCPVWTVESNKRWYAHARARFLLDGRITVAYGDSRERLRELGNRTDARQTIFAYLDAHWEEEIPLGEELEVIAETWPKAVVMIDDFQVPDDPGYEFDEYGPDKALTPDYLIHTAVASWPLLYPSADSRTENGRKRGCCVLTSPEVGPLELTSLRPASITLPRRTHAVDDAGEGTVGGSSTGLT